MIKKLPQKGLALLLSLITMIGVISSFFVFFIVEDKVNQWIALVSLSLVTGTLVYFAFRKILQIYLHRRIRLIYKMIRQSKSSRKEKKNQSETSDSLVRVETEVQNWIEEQQKELESLKQIETYRRNFLGNISHELKTPIFSVQGYIHTLLDGGLSDQQVNIHFLKKAAKNVERLETIIEDLDIIAKLEDATLQLELQNFNIKSLVQEVMEEVEVQAEGKDIKVRLKPGAESGYMVEADREYIRTVLVNLIVNSIKYGKEGGLTTVGFYDADNYVLVEVADNGIGIKEKHLKHLFDRFYRVDKSRSRDRGGSGLGLSIVKHIIEVHDQTINVKSVPGIGTTFSFTLEKARKI